MRFAHIDLLFVDIASSPSVYVTSRSTRPCAALALTNAPNAVSLSNSKVRVRSFYSMRFALFLLIAVDTELHESSNCKLPVSTGPARPVEEPSILAKVFSFFSS